MPLPASGTPWPPHEMARPYRAMAAHSAWYSGDREQLARIYGRADAEVRPSERKARFWSRPRDPLTKETRLHVPLAADIATTSADLLFSEPPDFSVEDADAQGRLEEIVEAAGVHNTLLEAAEVSSALGGVYLKADWDQGVASHPFLAAVHADAAVPEFRWGMLTAVTFWRVVHNRGTQVLRFLERHEAGSIEFGLYAGTQQDLGQVIPLTDRDAPDWVQQLADGLSAEGNVKTTGIDQLTAVYVPNMRPNRVLRGSPHGRSDFQSIEDLFDALDETWTSWMRDIRLAKSRLIVPDGFLQPQGRGQGSTFDDDREVWSTLNMAPSQTEGSGITANQFDIRVDEHQKTIAELTRQAVEIAGYSAQTFGLTGDVAVTATEVTARERRSFITRDKKTRYWSPALGHMLEVMLGLDRQLAFSQITPARPKVDFADSVSEDPKAVAETLELLERAKAISTQVKVQRLHPDWDEDAIAEEVGRIQGESGAAVANPDDVGAGPRSLTA